MRAAVSGLLCCLLVASVHGELDWLSGFKLDNFELEENTPKNSTVAQIRAVDVNTGSSNGILYGFNTDKGGNNLDLEPSNGILSIDPNTGTVTTAGVLDFDNPNSNVRSFTVSLLAKRSDNSEYVRLVKKIDVKNTNDQAPTFISTGKIFVDEGAIPAGGILLFGNMTAQDTDNILVNVDYIEAKIAGCEINNQTIPGCDGIFKMNQTYFSSDIFRGDIYLMRGLDFVESPLIIINLEATDGLQTGTSDVTVSVRNLQNLPPYWETFIYQVTTNEYAEGLPVTVVAVDGDDLGRPVHYTVLPDYFIPDNTNLVNASQIFTVDPFLGMIDNIVELDRESDLFKIYGKEEPKLELALKACEYESRDPLVLTDQCTQPEIMTIHIRDVNDNGPLFKQDPYTYFIYENEPTGRVLTDPRLDISDLDTEKFSRHTTQFIENSNEFEIIGANSNPMIKIKNSQLLDMDIAPREYTLTVSCSKISAPDKLLSYDQSDPTMSSTATVSIFLRDRNDNAPYFTQSSYSATVREDATEFTSILTVKAYDRDYDVNEHGNNSIEYSLVGPYNNFFMINPLSGLISVLPCPGKQSHGSAECIDFDTKPREYVMDIKATDNNNGPVALSTQVRLTIRALGVNDNEPKFKKDFYKRTITEGSREFQPELRVEAEDDDFWEGIRYLNYEILSRSPNRGIWVINNRTGVITLQKNNGEAIKYEDGDTTGKFILEVTATDGVYTALATVEISVLDINDNAPNFLTDPYYFEIPEDFPPNTFIFKCDAIDKDDPSTKNGELRFSLYNNTGKFAVDKEDCTVETSNMATFDVGIQKMYYMQIIVRDSGTPQQSSTASLTISILPRNVRDPVILPGKQDFRVYENELPGSLVGIITAVDADADANLTLEVDTTTIRAFNGIGSPVTVDQYDFRDLFRVSPKGEIFVNKPLDSEQTRDLLFNVFVYDITPSPPQRGEGFITIVILEFNNEPPVFENYTTPVRIPEGMPVGNLINNYIARDKNGLTHYNISQQPHDFFQVSRDTGSVTIANTIDYDGPERYNSSWFIIKVSDQGRPVQLTATASVSVIIYNINDEVPRFVDTVTRDRKFTYYASIKEEPNDGTDVTRVLAIDDDRPGENSFNVVRYFMDDDRFDVDPVSGEVKVRLNAGFRLDREQNTRIRVLVRAVDNPDLDLPAVNDPDLKAVQNTAGAAIQIELIDINDNPPLFTSDLYVVEINEMADVDTDILRVFTSDLDTGAFAEVLYRKVDNVGNDTDDLFAINEDSGQIFVAKSLIKKSRKYPYIFFIEAEDNYGVNGNTARAEVHVYITRSANSPPYFVLPPISNFTIFVLETQYRGMLVYDVKAVDDDTGVNGILDYSFIYEGKTANSTPEFRINSVTGVISAKVRFDRETQDRYVLLLKVTDRGSPSLEATRFLTVIIKDVNDNLPVFAETEVEFQISEVDPAGTDIGTVSATDADLDPEILYEIIGGNKEGNFMIERQTGLLELAQLLPSNHKSVYYLDVKATNPDPEYTVIRNRRRRSLDPSIIRVKILVGNVNDLAPVFLQDKYYGCVSTRSPLGKHILQVQARDEDAIGAGIVRYSVMGGHMDTTNNKTLFDIQPTLGMVTNVELMGKYANRVFSIIVNARDAEDPAQAESGNITVRVFVTVPGKEVRLLITQNTGEVRLYQSQIQSIIEQATDLDYLCINSINDHVTESAGGGPTLWSDVYVSGVRRDKLSGELVIISGIELRNIIDREMDSRQQDFDLLYIRQIELASSSDEIKLRDKAVLIILIIIAVLIFLVIIFCIVAFMCIRAAKQQKKQILVHRTHATPAPVIVAQEPVVEPVVYDNRTFVQEVVHVRAVEPEPEPVPVVVSTMEEEHVISHPPVHIEYATVVKGPQGGIMMVEDDDDQEEIVVELPQEDTPDVYEPEPQYRIIAEVEEK